MADLNKAAKVLEEAGFGVHVFSTAAEAAAWLDANIDGKTVGFGGSVTLRDMGLYEKLSGHNTVYWHWEQGPEARKAAMQADVYVTSVNALAESGEIVNIDGTGNRVAGTLYGHETVYYVIGRNKLTDDYDSAIWRARNVAAPKNAQRLGLKTPCAIKGDHCYNCKSPDRICCGMVTMWRPMAGMPAEILLIDEDLGM
jgi:hypothetical protein